MTQIEILWSPTGQTLEGLKGFRLVDITDGDTPNVRMPIRMLSIDTPETTARSEAGAARVDDRFAELADWIGQGLAPISPALAEFLLPKLPGGGTRQFRQGKAATEALDTTRQQRLRRDNGSERSLFLRVADERIDRYGRLLAYVAPNYSATELREFSYWERRTFNLDMIDQGWAAPFIIHPSIPGELDLPLMVSVAERAIAERRGIWADDLTLLAYEYRMMEKLHGITRKIAEGVDVRGGDRRRWRSRYCADLRDRQLYGPEDYFRVPPAYRLFVWPDQLRTAIAALNLQPVAEVGSAP